jgi:hypothetical protein
MAVKYHHTVSQFSKETTFYLIVRRCTQNLPQSPAEYLSVQNGKSKVKEYAHMTYDQPWKNHHKVSGQAALKWPDQASPFFRDDIQESRGIGGRLALRSTCLKELSARAQFTPLTIQG